MCSQIVLEQFHRSKPKDSEFTERAFRIKRKALSQLLALSGEFAIDDYSVSFPLLPDTVNETNDIVEILKKFEHVCHYPMDAAVAADNPRQIEAAKKKLNCALFIAKDFPDGLAIKYAAHDACIYSCVVTPTVYDINKALGRLKPAIRPMIETFSDLSPAYVSPEGIAAFGRAMRGARDPEVIRQLEENIGTPLRMDVDTNLHTFRVRVPVITRVY